MNTGTNETEDDSMCVDKAKPTKYQKCNLQECRKNTGTVVYLHETVSKRLSLCAEVLQKLGTDSVYQLALGTAGSVIAGQPGLLLLGCSVGRTTLLCLPALSASCFRDGECSL